MSDQPFTVRQRANGTYVGQCRFCAAKEVHGEAAWAERLISLHVDQEHATADTDVQSAVEDYLERSKYMDTTEAMLMGMLVSLLRQHQSEGLLGNNIALVESITDDDGNYSNMLRVTMESGAVFIVHAMETEQ